jgi:hypothetical protein
MAAEALGLGRQQLALDELVHDRLLEARLPRLARAGAGPAAEEVAEAEVVLRDGLPGDLGRVMIRVARDLLARHAARLRAEAEHEDQNQESEDAPDDPLGRLGRFAHTVEHDERGPP